jgi:type I restriction enzyme R subunit
LRDLAHSRNHPCPSPTTPTLPPEFFDAIIVDECHRSIYSVWGDVLKYFDAFLVGLTATPSKQTIGFFNQNLVMEYGHEQAVADRVNVPYDVYEIRTRITSQGSKLDAGYFVGKRSRKTRVERQEELDQEFEYGADELDKSVVSVSQIRTVIQTFRDRLFVDIFPGRTEVPKTIIFAKDDSHADDIVRIVREEFGKGNDFCQKITYRTGVMRLTRKVTDPDGSEREEVYYEKTKGKTGEDVLVAFRNSFNPRIAVTVDMIATGTDVKPVEIVFFMRSVKSSNYFEQMKGRGVRVMPTDMLKGVTPDAKSKTRFVIIDAVGVCEQCKSEKGPLDREPSKSLKQVLDYIKAGGTDPDAVFALAGKLNRLSTEMSEKQHADVKAHAGGKALDALVGGLVAAIDDANVEAKAQAINPGVALSMLTEKQLEAAEQDVHQGRRQALLRPEAPRPAPPDQAGQRADHRPRQQGRGARRRLLPGRAGQGQGPRSPNFKKFIDEHKDELTALQVFFGMATPDRLRFRDLKELADRDQASAPVSATPEELWHCYEALEAAKVARARAARSSPTWSPSSGTRSAPASRSRPSPTWSGSATRRGGPSRPRPGVTFTAEQAPWLDKIAEHIATSLAIEMEDFHDGWFASARQPRQGLRTLRRPPARSSSPT